MFYTAINGNIFIYTMADSIVGGVYYTIIPTSKKHDHPQVSDRALRVTRESIGLNCECMRHNFILNIFPLQYILMRYA